MSSLADFQNTMSTSLRDSSAPCPQQIVQQGKDQQSRRFNIYRNNRVVSLIDNLQAVYPTISQLVGDEFFRAVARLFIKKSPPTTPVMAEYGGDFAEFLSDFPKTQSIPYIADMARLEWARLGSYHAQNATALTADVLATFSPEALETLCFSVHPSLSVVASRWPVGSIWSAIEQATGEPVVDMNRPEDVVVVRPQFDVCLHILPADGALLLRRLQQGTPLLTAVDHVTQQYPDFNPGIHLQGLFGLGAFNATYQQGN